MTLNRRDFTNYGLLAGLLGGSSLVTAGRAASSSSVPPGRPMFIDTDTASDDAVALMMALSDPAVSVVGISTVAGNVPIDVATRNAIYIRNLCKSKAPVYRGSAKPLIRSLETVDYIHGKDGMGDVGLPIKDLQPESADAIGAIIAAVRKYRGSLELVTLGPLTNIAKAVLQAPDIAGDIEHCVVMGGVSDYVGNITALSEFNLWVDPEAASIVLKSGIPMLVVGWDMARKYAMISDEDAASIRAIGTEKARVAMDCQAVLRAFVEKLEGVKAFDISDPIAMAVALQPSVATRLRTTNGLVLTAEGQERGALIFDDRDRDPEFKRLTIVEEASREAFMDILRKSLRD